MDAAGRLYRRAAAAVSIARRGGCDEASPRRQKTAESGRVVADVCCAVGDAGYSGLGAAPSAAIPHSIPNSGAGHGGGSAEVATICGGSGSRFGVRRLRRKCARHFRSYRQHCQQRALQRSVSAPTARQSPVQPQPQSPKEPMQFASEPSAPQQFQPGLLPKPQRPRHVRTHFAPQPRHHPGLYGQRSGHKSPKAPTDCVEVGSTLVTAASAAMAASWAAEPFLSPTLHRTAAPLAWDPQQHAAPTPAEAGPSFPIQSELGAQPLAAIAADCGASQARMRRLTAGDAPAWASQPVPQQPLPPQAPPAPFADWDEFMDCDLGVKHRTPITDIEFDFLLAREVQSLAGWEVCVDRPGLRVATAQAQGGGVVAVRAWATLQGVEMRAARSMLLDMEARKRWAQRGDKGGDGSSGSSSASRGKSERLLALDVQVIYSSMAVPTMTTRDLVQYRRVRAQDGSTLIVQRSAEHPLAPEDDRFIRAEAHFTGYALRAAVDHKSGQPCLNLFLDSHVDIKGFVPKWLLRQLAPRRSVDWLTNLERASLYLQQCTPVGK